MAADIECGARDAHKLHPLEVLLYAARHGYPHIMYLAEQWSMVPTEALKVRFISPVHDLHINKLLQTRSSRWAEILQYASTYVQVCKYL